MIYSPKAQRDMDQFLTGVQPNGLRKINGVYLSTEFLATEDFLFEDYQDDSLQQIEQYREILEAKQDQPPGEREAFGDDQQFHVNSSAVRRLLNDCTRFFCPNCDDSLVPCYSRLVREYGEGSVSLFGELSMEVELSTESEDRDAEYSCQGCENSIEFEDCNVKMSEQVQTKIVELFQWILEITPTTVPDSLPAIAALYAAEPRVRPRIVINPVTLGGAQPRATYALRDDVHVSTAEDFLFTKTWTCQNCRNMMTPSADICSHCFANRY